jgi:redox-sensitive bicupin YhaK (pirin superfamily)
MGAKVRRSIGGAQLRNFDPFLLLDEFHVQAPAGFPDHPHRGMSHLYNNRKIITPIIY